MLGDRRGIALALSNLSNAAVGRGDYVLADTYLHESLLLFDQLGDQRNVAYVLQSLGDAAIGQGDWQLAQSWCEQSLRLRRELGDLRGIADCLEALAHIAGARKEDETAASLWGAAAALRQTISIPLPPYQRARYEADVAAVRARLGEAGWAAAWAAGQARPLPTITGLVHSPRPGQPSPDPSQEK
jgi:tetratricopeptide (TPR) repeat protein